MSFTFSVLHNCALTFRAKCRVKLVSAFRCNKVKCPAQIGKHFYFNCSHPVVFVVIKEYTNFSQTQHFVFLLQ